MKVLIYQPRISYYVGGAEMVALQHAKYLAEQGHQVTVLTSRADFLPESQHFMGFKLANPLVEFKYIEIPEALRWVYEVKPGVDWKRWDLESIYFAKLALAQFPSEPYDALILHGVMDTLGVPAGYQTKTFLHLHGFPEHTNYAHELALSEPVKLIAVSQLVAQKWNELLGLSNIVVSTNGIDTKMFAPDVQVGKRYDFVFVGRLLEVKGAQYAIAALDKLRSMGVVANLAIAGEGPYATELKELVDRLGLASQVDWLGQVPNHELRQLYNSAKVSLVPAFSRDGVATTLLEPAACGVPSISTLGSSMTEFIEDGVTGMLVLPQNVEALADAMMKLLSDEQLRERLGNQAYQKIVAGWSWEAKIKDLERIYFGVNEVSEMVR